MSAKLNKAAVSREERRMYPLNGVVKIIDLRKSKGVWIKNESAPIAYAFPSTSPWTGKQYQRGPGVW